MILIIDNYDSFTYNLYQCMIVHYPDIQVVRNDKITLQDIQHMQPKGIVLSPGPGRPEHAGICMDLVRSENLPPLLGVCLGLQAIVAAFGGRIVQAPEIMHGKHDLIFHHRKGIYQQLSLPFQAGRYHSLMADRTTLPDSLIIEAETAMGLIMGVRHVTKPIFGMQFHPESILTPSGHLLLQDFIQLCKQHGDV